jgi:hypothetical protein
MTVVAYIDYALLLFLWNIPLSHNTFSNLSEEIRTIDDSSDVGSVEGSTWKIFKVGDGIATLGSVGRGCSVI